MPIPRQSQHKPSGGIAELDDLAGGTLPLLVFVGLDQQKCDRAYPGHPIGAHSARRSMREI
jgi:hypothetical protein